MSNIEFTVISIPTHLSRNKSKEWREQTIRTFTSLCSFLYKNQLITGVNPFYANGELNLDTVIKISNLTSEGLEFYKMVIPGWYSYLDKSIVGDKYENVSRLEKGLAKLREGNKLINQSKL